MVGYRLIHWKSIIIPGSYCPHCKHPLAWYDNIPLLSFIILCGKCRYCKNPISWLYPFIELITLIAMLALLNSVDSHYWPAYFIFFSALIVTIRSDFESMLISRFATIFLIPLGFLFAYSGIFTNFTRAQYFWKYIWLFGLTWFCKIICMVYQQTGHGPGRSRIACLYRRIHRAMGLWIR